MTLAPTDGERLHTAPGLPGGIHIHARTNDGTPRAARCSICSHISFAGSQAACDYLSLMTSHLRQHAQGRAMDITVDWTPEATCSVCENGGDIATNDDGGLTCGDCGTAWTLDGTTGFLADPEDHGPTAACPTQTEGMRG